MSLSSTYSSISYCWGRLINIKTLGENLAKNCANLKTLEDIEKIGHWHGDKKRREIILMDFSKFSPPKANTSKTCHWPMSQVSLTC